jgi:hypothetical protein
MTSAITHTFDTDLSNAIHLDDHMLVVVAGKTLEPVKGVKLDLCLWIDYKTSTPLVDDTGVPLSTFSDCTLDKVMMEYNVGSGVDKQDKFQVYLTTHEAGKIVLASEVKSEASCSLLQALTAMSNNGRLTYPFDLCFYRGSQGRKPTFATIRQSDPDCPLDPDFERDASPQEMRSDDVYKKQRKLIGTPADLRSYNIELARDIYRALKKSTATVTATTVEAVAE